MALFGSGRDASLLRHLSREIMQRFLSIEVEFYKLSLPDTETNIYGESRKKTYYHPVKLFALVQKEDKTATDTDTGLDFSKLVTFYFLRDDLTDINLVLEEGDIIRWDLGYYEVDNVRQPTYWVGRNPSTLPAVTQGDIPEHGYNMHVVAETHLTRENAVLLREVRSGVNNIKNSGNLPRGL
jgi:hypothetical protein